MSPKKISARMLNLGIPELAHPTEMLLTERLQLTPGSSLASPLRKVP